MSRLRTLAAAVLVTVAAGASLVLPAAPASAAACTTDAGVSVVVDFAGLGGGVDQVCLPDGGGDKAAALFAEAGFPLTYAQRQPGFVCRVSGLPTSDPCVNTSPEDAYWGLWWSDGETGEWVYSTLGVGSLSIPDGGYVAFAFDDSASDQIRPGVAPATHPDSTPSPSTRPTTQPTARPTTRPTDRPTALPTGSTDGPRSTTEPSGPGSGAVEATSAATSADEESAPSDPASNSSTASTASTDEPSDGSAGGDATPPTSEDDGGLPTWVAPVLVALLLGAAGVAVVVRRRTGGDA
ncbi:unannotated protein [freshwater metagenome]|uniref:Unannotated protein n=1 Tax=freshwater metagenome TaxID=449393 RepID=A0A6J6P4J0_9ZZZZ